MYSNVPILSFYLVYCNYKVFNFIDFIYIYLFILYRAVLKTTSVRTHPVLKIIIIAIINLIYSRIYRSAPNC